MNYDSQSFKDESIELSSNRFHGCTFERCELVWRLRRTVGVASGVPLACTARRDRQPGSPHSSGAHG